MSLNVLVSTQLFRSETGPELASPSSSSLQSPASLSSPPPNEGQEAQGRAEQLLQTRAEDAVSPDFDPKCHPLFPGKNLPTIHCS